MDHPPTCWTSGRARLVDEEGASLIEYALLLALIALVCIGAITLIGENTQRPLSETSSALLG